MYVKCHYDNRKRNYACTTRISYCYDTNCTITLVLIITVSVNIILHIIIHGDTGILIHRNDGCKIHVQRHVHFAGKIEQYSNDD